MVEMKVRGRAREGQSCLEHNTRTRVLDTGSAARNPAVAPACTPPRPPGALQVLLAAIFRGHAVKLQQPDEPWLLFPLARPKHGMPARIVPATAAEE